MSARPTRVRHGVVAWLALAAALAYLARNGVGVAESSVREDLGLSFEQSGWFMGAFFWSYALLQVPSGWFAHRRGTRFAMATFAVSWSVATLLLAAAPGLWLLILAQLVMGAAQAGIFPASCLSVSRWIPLSRRSLACGLLAVGMQVGAVLAATLTGPLVESLGWRFVFALFALPGFLWTAGFLARFRDDPADHPRINEAELALVGEASAGAPENSPGAGRAEPSPWAAMLRSGPLWLLCGQQVCRAAGYMFFATWFPTFLQETRGISVKDSGYLQALVLVGTLAGSLVGGWFADAVWRRTGSLRLSRSGVGAVFLAACGLLILGAWFVKGLGPAVALLALGSFFAAVAGPPTFTASIDLGGSHVPQVFGLVNMSGNLAAAATPVLVGALFARTTDWNAVLILFACVYLAGSVCWIFVDPRRRIVADS